MLCWADGGWNFDRCIGFASFIAEGMESHVVLPVFNPHASSPLCEYESLILAITLTPNSPDVVINMDARSVVEQVVENKRCSVLELIPYVRWCRRNLGDRSLVWIPRAENRAHVPLSNYFSSDDSWDDYEYQVLKERRRF